jgi:hypothetical protein
LILAGVIRVGEFEIDPELGETFDGIRESVRRLFEQLRLKHQDGDVSGKERLERVPALAKRNFRNLRGPNPHLAIKQAWRLVDFLEAVGADGHLSLHARDGLRAIEVDKQLGSLRASDHWKEAALQLRQAIDRRHGNLPVSEVPEDNGRFDPGRSVISESATPSPEPLPSGRKSRRPMIIGLVGATVSAAFAGMVATWWSGEPINPRYACLALEGASAGELAAHWGYDHEPSGARPAPHPDARPHAYQIEDPVSGRPVQSIWTTSTFSYAEGTDRPGPGGGKPDFRLRVGGWGDTYLSLLQIPVPTNRLVQKAVLQLTVLGDDGSSRPTTMTLRAVADNWQARLGPNNRLWWRDCPRSGLIRRHLPPAGPRDSIYEIDITDLYNLWALGQQSPYGIILEPEHIGSWGPGRPHYSNFNTFYSTRALDPANRPRLILTY